MTEQGDRPKIRTEEALLRVIFGDVRLTPEEESARRRMRTIRVLNLPEDTALTDEELREQLGQYYLNSRTVQEMFMDHVNKVFAPLNDRQRRVLELRFGLSVDREMTLGEVGKTLAIEEGRNRPFSVSNIWGIEHRALAKLRSPENTAKMREALQ